MSFETFIARRYLFALRKQSFISLVSLFAVCGVAIGVASLIVVIGVMNGFSKDLQEKILGITADIIVGGAGAGITRHEEMTHLIMDVDGVVGATPFIYAEGMLSVPGAGVKGVGIRAIDPATAGDVISLPRDMIAGDLEGLNAPLDRPGILVGKQLADRFGLRVGSEVFLVSPAGTQTASGFSPKTSPFEVAGVFRTGMYEYDSTLAYTTLPAARQLLGYPPRIVSGIEIKVDDVYDVARITTDLYAALEGWPVDVQNWQGMNENLFAALKLEKAAMFIILIMIVLVGSFSIVTTLVMLVTQKTKDIAIMMSMGAGAWSIRKIFMLQGTFIGLFGTALGFALGMPLSFLLKKYQFIKLPENVYPVDYLPIRMEGLDLVIIGVSAFALCFLATLYPARRAAKLNPADALRYE